MVMTKKQKQLANHTKKEVKLEELQLLLFYTVASRYIIHDSCIFKVILHVSGVMVPHNRNLVQDFLIL